MVTMVFLSADTRLNTQVGIWAHELTQESRVFEVYRSIADFKEGMEKAVAEVDAASRVLQPDEVRGKQIRLIAIDLDMLRSAPEKIFGELKTFLQEKASVLFEDRKLPHFLALGYDQGSAPNSPVNGKLSKEFIESFDDLILKPLDKTLFLQKSEFLLSADPDIEPSFLFRAEVNREIEIGSETIITELSELSLGVLTEEPVEKNSFAYLHSDIFGAKGLIRRLLVRALEVKMDEFGFNHVKYQFFGIQPEQLSPARRSVRTKQDLTKPIGNESLKKPTAVGVSDQLRERMSNMKMRKIAIIDSSPTSIMELTEVIESGLKGATVVKIPSYARFAGELAKLKPQEKTEEQKTLEEKPSEDLDPSKKPTGPAFPFSRKMSLLVATPSMNFLRFDPALKQNETVLGSAGIEWMRKGEQWLKTIHPDDREVVDEFLQQVDKTGNGRVVLRMLDSESRCYYLQGEGSIDKVGAKDGSRVIRFTMNEIDAKKFNEISFISRVTSGEANDPSAYKFDAVLIEAALVRPGAKEWYEHFLNLMRGARVLSADDPAPKIFVMGDPRSGENFISVEDYTIPEVNDFIVKPVDRRYLIQRLNAAIPGLVPARGSEPTPAVKCDYRGFLTQRTLMTEVSEYGLAITSPLAFPAKTVRYFFSEFFGETGWVKAKAAYAQKANGKNDDYISQFMYFGVLDEVLQKIRRWVREDYVAKKGDDYKGVAPNSKKTSAR